MNFQVDGVGDESHAAQGGQSAAIKTGKDQFLELLVAQISHQDPMNPMDDKDLVTQLAQFTGVEQAIETNSRLAALQTAVTGQTHTALTNVIGKYVIADGSVVHLDGSGAPETIGFNLNASAERVRVSIVDGAGRIVNAMDLGQTGAGNQNVTWDGRGAHGQALPPGDYRVRIDAVDEHDNRVVAETKVAGIVSGLAFTPTGPEIRVGGAVVRPSEIIEIKAGPEPKQDNTPKT
jgi:flagellar basal-body rod modification protein FlgD